MTKALILITILIWPFTADTQLNNISITHHSLIPVISSKELRLGNNKITIRLFQYGDNRDIVFVNLHDNEATSVTAAKKILQTRGGLLIKIVNREQRNISFKLDDRNYSFDPNRMFSKTGIIQTLKRYGNSGKKAIAEIETFAAKFLKTIPEEVKCIIALHNNTDSGFSTSDYLPGKEKAKDASQIKMAEGQDLDDFFLTTDSLLFSLLSAKNYNTILQDNIKAIQDGSLSVYFGEKNIRYINCETEHGKVKQHEEMLEAALQCIEELKKLYSSSQ